jgi:hypothetical protein
VRLGEVLVLADDDRRAGPEVLRVVLVVVGQPHQDVVPLADVDAVPARGLRVGPDQAVDAGPLHLGPLGQVRKLGARRDEDLSGPVDDLGGQDARGDTIDEVEPDRLALHGTSGLETAAGHSAMAGRGKILSSRHAGSGTGRGFLSPPGPTTLRGRRPAGNHSEFG